MIFTEHADELTNYFDGLLVVELLVPVEHSQKWEGGEEDEANSEEHVAGETSKINPLWGRNREKHGCDDDLNATNQNGGIIHHWRQT